MQEAEDESGVVEPARKPRKPKQPVIDLDGDEEEAPADDDIEEIAQPGPSTRKQKQAAATRLSKEDDQRRQLEERKSALHAQEDHDRRRPNPSGGYRLGGPSRRSDALKGWPPLRAETPVRSNADGMPPNTRHGGVKRRKSKGNAIHPSDPDPDVPNGGAWATGSHGFYDDKPAGPSRFGGGSGGGSGFKPALPNFKRHAAGQHYIDGPHLQSGREGRDARSGREPDEVQSARFYGQGPRRVLQNALDGVGSDPKRRGGSDAAKQLSHVGPGKGKGKALPDDMEIVALSSGDSRKDEEEDEIMSYSDDPRQESMPQSKVFDLTSLKANNKLSKGMKSKAESSSTASRNRPTTRDSVRNRSPTQPNIDTVFAASPGNMSTGKGKGKEKTGAKTSLAIDADLEHIQIGPALHPRSGTFTPRLAVLDGHCIIQLGAKKEMWLNVGPGELAQILVSRERPV